MVIKGVCDPKGRDQWRHTGQSSPWREAEKVRDRLDNVLVKCIWRLLLN